MSSFCVVLASKQSISGEMMPFFWIVQFRLPQMDLQREAFSMQAG